MTRGLSTTAGTGAPRTPDYQHTAAAAGLIVEGLAAMSDTTPKAIAQWMLSRLEQSGRLYQAEAVQGIVTEFGDEYTYLNANGNPAIGKRILKASSGS